jgi:hypothetical protein
MQLDGQQFWYPTQSSVVERSTQPQIILISMAENSNFQRIWATAFESYKKKTDRDLRDKSFAETLGDLNNVEALERKIGELSGGFDHFREKHRKLADNVRTCFEPLQQLGGVINKGLALTPYAPAGAIFGAGLFLIKVSTPLI